MILDVSVEMQEYIEDCETCCHPIQIVYKTIDSKISDFSANSIEQ